MRRPLLLVFILMLTACHHRRTPARALPPAPPPTVTPVVLPDEPVPVAVQPTPVLVPEPAPPAPEPSPLDQADMAFNAGSYVDAARIYETVLHGTKPVENKDALLFHLALSYALPQNPNADWNKIAGLLKQVVDQYPHSIYKPEANLILNLLTDSQKRDQRIKQLTNDLDKLKQIDADRRKRP